MDLTPFTQHPNILSAHYKQFNVENRLLLNGHSHQAWPDCSQDGLNKAWLDAAEHHDDKWQLAAEKANRVRRGFMNLLSGDTLAKETVTEKCLADTISHDISQNISLGQNTHELLIQFLSALPLKDKPRIVTTDSEFYTVQRQLKRLSEEVIEIIIIKVEPIESFSLRFSEAINHKTATAILSHVFFNTALQVPDFHPIVEQCKATSTPLMVDVYHSLNIIPFSIQSLGLDSAYIIGGGYKYCQLGEGNCFIRFPKDCTLRPIITGWFSDFSSLDHYENKKNFVYGEGHLRFAGATYDPSSHYRAVEVFDFFKKHNLTPTLLRKINLHQLQLIATVITDAKLSPKKLSRATQVSLTNNGGFLSYKSPLAKSIHLELKKQNVHCDCRGEYLRFGPAPYMSDQQLLTAMEHVVAHINNL